MAPTDPKQETLAPAPEQVNDDSQLKVEPVILYAQPNDVQQAHSRVRAKFDAVFRALADA